METFVGTHQARRVKREISRPGNILFGKLSRRNGSGARMDWISFYDFKHSVIYVNPRHRDVHYRTIAEDISRYVPSPTASVLDYGCG